MIDHLLTMSATLRRIDRTTTDAEGNPTSTASTSTVACYVEQRGATSERQRDHLDVTTTWRVFLPAGTSISADDELVIDGVTYHVDGDPWQVHNPRVGAVSHVEANLVTRSHL